MLLLSLDPAAPEPLYRQLIRGVADRVEDGSLRPGDRLPPTRKLAEDLGVHRSTVVRAWAELRALGYLDSRSGSYSTVRRRARPPGTRVERDQPPERRLDFEELATDGARAARAAVARQVPLPARPGSIDLSRLTADPTLAPTDELRRCLDRAVARGGGAGLDYHPGPGHPELRDFLARRMRAHGIAVSAGQVLLTQGAQQGLDLVLRLLVEPGAPVVVEAPGYGKARALFELHRARLLPVPMRSDGMDLDTLEALMASERPRLVYTVPTFHNPTGVTTDQAHRERLLALCEQHGVPLLEDGFEEELKYLGQAVLPIKSMDAAGVVFYLGTFSKVAFPGLRLGWLAAPASAMPLLTALHRASCLSGVGLVQAAVARFCRSGGLEAYLRRIHRIYRRRMRALTTGLAQHLPAGVAWTRPAGGYTTWLTVTGCPITDVELAGRLLEAGVRVTPGRTFFGRPPEEVHLRVSSAVEPEERIEEGCRRLGAVLAGVGSGG